jgi:hypothetical protein
MVRRTAIHDVGAVKPPQLAVLENGRIAMHFAAYEKARVIIKTVTKHQVYVEQDGERLLYGRCRYP